jgi:hypothetical protein
MTVFDVSDRSRDLRARLSAFMEEHIYPNEGEIARARRRPGCGTCSCRRPAAGAAHTARA